jgi:uncharacterized hydrophobic protein (TIGR00271 family)
MVFPKDVSAKKLAFLFSCVFGHNKSDYLPYQVGVMLLLMKKAERITTTKPENQAKDASKPDANKQKPTTREQLPHPESYYAMRVVVPVANPQTTPHLLRFAAALLHPEKGRLIALYVKRPDSPYKDSAEEIKAICDRARQGGMPVEFEVITSANVPRGVLDVTRERGADLLVLGFRQPKGDSGVVLGDITEEIARVVPNNIVVYRHVSDEINRIIVPMSSLEGSRTAMIHALHLAHVYDKPVVALFVRDYRPPNMYLREQDPFWLQRARIYDAIHELPDSQRIDTEVLHADDLVEGINQFTDEHDLIVYSVEPQSSATSSGRLERWVFGATAEKLLRLTPGPLALLRRGMPQPTLLQRLSTELVRIRPTLTIDERSEVVQAASDLTRANTNYLVMIILSSVLASVGLLQSSVAVVIGAMLVAPLMSPLMGFGVGLALGDVVMMRRSTLTVMHGVGLVVLTSVLTGLIFPLPNPTPEMAARGEPNLLDLFVALASGAAGAFALARRDIPAALAGVAIAAALVPPICTTGLALANGETSLMLGAGALSLVNIIGISITAAGVFSVLGIQQQGSVPAPQRLTVSAGILLLLVLPLGFLLRAEYIQLNTSTVVENTIERQLEDTDVREVEVVGVTNNLDVTVTIVSSQEVSDEDIADIEADIEAELERDIDLEVIVMQRVRGGS